ncbi:lamin tail domain-containing protein [Herbiconiux sp. P18]|uniref:lamin tail domain-containing protein n=1 Tax=Herbiconiux liangxiaofengii TaxID=3342795 RepID=UPI0035B71E62
MLNPVSRPLALLAGSGLVLAGLIAVPGAAMAAETAAASPQVRITEWAYNGSEFVEFTNLDAASVDLAGWSFSDSGAKPGDVDLSAAGVVTPGESFILSQASAADFRAEWGVPETVPVIGGNTVNLGRADAINLYDAADTLVDTLSYDDQAGAGPRTDTASAWPSTEAVIGTDDAAGWTKSTAGDAEGSWTSTSGIIGSPGVSRFGSAFDWLRLNEIQTDENPDWVELINTSTQPLDAAGAVLTGRQNGVTLTVPSGTVVAPGGVVVAESPTFKLKKSDQLTLSAPGGTKVLDSYEWGDLHLDTYGRLPNGTGEFVQQAAPSKGELNPDVGPVDPGEGDDAWKSVKLNEVTSANDDPTHDAYELVNTGDTDVDVSAWKQADSTSNPAALDAPNGTVVPAHGYLVLLSNQGLSSGGDSVKVYLADGATIVDSVGWGANDAQPGSWSRCGDATGAWAHTAASSWGVSNAEACAGQIIPPSNPDNGGGVPCQTEGASGSGPAIAGGIAWPGSQDWKVSDNECQFVSSLSGQDVSGLDIDPSDPGVLWAVKNKSHLYRLVKSGDLWVPDTANGWAGGKDIVFPSGGGQPDSEGITVGPDGFLYITTERDNTASGVPLESVLRYDPNATGAILQPTTQWVLTADLADAISTTGSADSNLGFEGITWVPDSYLTANGFVDQSTGAAYDPADYAGHGTGLFFAALEKNGHLYAYALNDDGSFHRVGSIATGLPMIQETQWDPDAQRIWAVADNSSAGSTTLLKIGTDGAFAVDRVYNRPTGLPDYNLEGFAIAPNSTCENGVKEVIRADDGNNGGHSLWSGTIACDLQLGPQGPNPPAETTPTVTATPSTVQAGGTTTIRGTGLAAGTQYLVVLHSDPVTLGSAVAGTDGTLTLAGVTIPADAAAGAHTIILSTAADPGTAIASTAFTVTAAPAAVPTPGPTPGPSASPASPTGNGSTPAGLASTGAEPLPWVAAGTLGLLLGAGLVLLRRRAARA